MAELQLRNLKKNFDRVEVIRSLNLDIKTGEFVVFVGPSGCGKTTLLRMIAGLETVTEGSIFIDAEDVTKAEPSNRGIAMVFQTYALYPHMTVEENMAFGLEMAKTPKEERAVLVRKAAETLDLEPYLKRKPKALSGGQRQRVAIGRAIVRNPKIFLFDEPLSNLDAELRVHMRLEIAKLHARLGATMIYVTHDQVEAMTLASRIVVLRDGVIEQVGTPSELYGDPDNIFVAGFIGSPKMNMLDATVVGRDADGRVLLDVPRLGLDNLAIPPRTPDTDIPEELVLGIRPEHFHPADTQIQGHIAQIRCEVLENLGGVSYIYTDIGRENALTVELRGEVGVTVGETLPMAIRPQDCFLFATDGKRL
jgi:ABC-type sugar transport system ATPase subunit